MKRSSRTLSSALMVAFLLLWPTTRAHAVFIDEFRSLVPLRNNTTEGALILCEGSALPDHSGCAAGVSMSDVVFFEKVGLAGTFADLFSDTGEAADETGVNAIFADIDLRTLTLPDKGYFVEEEFLTSYTPTELSQPGFQINIAGQPPTAGKITYIIDSDPIPEPPTVVLLLGAAMMLAYARGRVSCTAKPGCWTRR